MIGYNIDNMEDDVKKYIEQHGYQTRYLPFNYNLYDLLSYKSYISYLPPELINYIINEYLHVEERVVEVSPNEDFTINDNNIYLLFKLILFLLNSIIVNSLISIKDCIGDGLNPENVYTI